MSLNPFFQSRSLRITVGLVGASLFAIGFLPQFGGLGYEYSVACGVILPTAAAIATALEISRDPKQPRVMVRIGLKIGLSVAIVALFVGLFHGLRVGICDFWGGLETFVLTAGIGACLGGLWGVVAGIRAMNRKRRRLAAVLVAALGPLGGIVLSLYRFYSSPMVFAYDPFFGFFSGTLYDTVVDAGIPLLTYRLGSVSTMACALLTASFVELDDGKIFRLKRTYDRILASVVLALFSLALIVMGPRLGHWETPETIAHELGGRFAGARCDVVYPKTLRDDEVALLAKDCDEEIASAEKVFAIKTPYRITAFFFHDAAEKRRLMGAADTYIAKPWRHEVYLQLANYPHPVLGHEIAHAVAGTFGRGPFRIAGSLNGLWPNPGLIEGVAVAASPDEDELTDMEWAAAIKSKGKLPPISEIFSVDFLGGSASKSYTLAGAFVRWVMDTRGPELVRAWYGGASFEQLMGKSWSGIDSDFRAALDAIHLPAEALEYVDSKFERPSVWRRKCPHVVDALKRGGDICRDAHDIAGARSLYEHALEGDAHDFSARLALGAMELRDGDAVKGTRYLEQLTQDQTPLAYVHKARESMADRAFQEGDFERARTTYLDLASHTPDEDVARTLQIKAIAVANPDARGGVLALLIGEKGRAPDSALAAARLSEWETRKHDPLADYLLGRTTAQRGDFSNAVPFLERALPAVNVLPARIGREVIRQRVIAACALRDRPTILAIETMLADAHNPFYGSAGGRLEVVTRLMDRCLAR